MVELENLGVYGLDSVIMNVSDLIAEHALSSAPEKGLQMQRGWITPEGCYNLYKFLSSDKTGVLARPKVLELLKQGTNHPELL